LKTSSISAALQQSERRNADVAGQVENNAETESRKNIMCKEV
jgi:hypothetical protein